MNGRYKKHMHTSTNSHKHTHTLSFLHTHHTFPFLHTHNTLHVDYPPLHSFLPPHTSSSSSPQGCRALQGVGLQYLQQQLVNGTVYADMVASLVVSHPAVLQLLDTSRCVLGCVCVGMGLCMCILAVSVYWAVGGGGMGPCMCIGQCVCYSIVHHTHPTLRHLPLDTPPLKPYPIHHTGW